MNTVITPDQLGQARLPDSPAPTRTPAPILAPAQAQVPTPAPPPILAADPGRGTAAEWVRPRCAEIRGQIEQSGAILVRGLGIRSAAEVAEIADALGIERMPDREQFAPRSSYAENVYSSSEWPADEPMCMHHELSHAAEVPGLLVFGCLTAPARGGRTAVADSQAVLGRLPAALVADFSREGWLLTRMYHEVGVPWSKAFGTTDRALVEAYCAGAGVEFEWLQENRLRTRQRRSAVLRHPRTGVPTWLNQAAFLNELTLDPAIRDYLVDVYGPSGLPFNTSYGDGTALAAETVDTINQAYREATAGWPWQNGDVLLVDNLRMAHSREAYEGSREIVVILGDPTRLAEHILPCPTNPGA